MEYEVFPNDSYIHQEHRRGFASLAEVDHDTHQDYLARIKELEEEAEGQTIVATPLAPAARRRRSSASGCGSSRRLRSGFARPRPARGVEVLGGGVEARAVEEPEGADVPGRHDGGERVTHHSSYPARLASRWAKTAPP
jgi:hypothetical protein